MCYSSGVCDDQQEVIEVARPAFRKPWEHGAKAYHEADNLAAIETGMKRKRSPFTVLIHHSTHALDGVACHACGEDLDKAYTINGGDDSVGPDTYAMVDVDPKSKTVKLRHYYCAWTTTLAQVVKLREVMGA